MSGNVFDWTHSSYKAYPYDAMDGREDEEKYVAHIIRGCAFRCVDGLGRCARRKCNVDHGTQQGTDYIGFRMVIAPPASKVIELAQKSFPVEIKPSKISEQMKAVPITLPSNKLTLSNGLEFVRVPAGNFLMGSDDGDEDEMPQHTVDIPYDYWMARFPVTNKLYNDYVKAKGIKHPVDEWYGMKEHPVVNVASYETMEYCEWLNALLKNEIPSGLVLCLPTEAEWEKAARGTDGREYSWGDEFDINKCNSWEGEKGGTTSVGSYSPQGDSLYGCADMTGNVLEWTCSIRRFYPFNIKSIFKKPSAEDYLALRGGSWVSNEYESRVSYRDGAHPDQRLNTYGFRVAISLLKG